MRIKAVRFEYSVNEDIDHGKDVYGNLTIPLNIFTESIEPMFFNGDMLDAEIESPYGKRLYKCRMYFTRDVYFDKILNINVVELPFRCIDITIEDIKQEWRSIP